MKIAFLASIFMAGLSPMVALADGNTGMLRGVVKSYSSGRPIANARVAWSNPSGVGWARTDRNGRFYLFGVTPGVTTVVANSGKSSGGCSLQGIVGANETVYLAITLFGAKWPSTYRCSSRYVAGAKPGYDF